jgi:hypothetical protein
MYGHGHPVNHNQPVWLWLLHAGADLTNLLSVNSISQNFGQDLIFWTILGEILGFKSTKI